MKLAHRSPLGIGLLPWAIAVMGCNAIFGLDDLAVDRGAGGANGGAAGVGTGGAGGLAGASGSGGIGGGCSTAGDCPPSRTACAEAACINGQCGSTPNALGLECDEAGGKVCDGKGACVECTVGDECPSGQCKASSCVPASCSDSAKDGAETDVDCGGPDCLGCSPGKTCAGGNDCLSGVCTAGGCQAPTCNDGVKNGPETDSDCGGGCPGCLDGKVCLVPGDCQSGVCGAGMCLAPTCSDGVQNGGESDMDCGGPCAGCAVGGGCVFAADCGSGLCTAGKCALLNGCGPATAVDLTGIAATTIVFGGANMYMPACVRVSVGTAVTFDGNFSAHPLAGGEVKGNQAFPDPTSPFMPITNSGPPKTFTFGTPGDYPYYCTTHFAVGMIGTVFVVP